MTDARTFTVSEDDDGIRLDRWFKRHMPEVSFNIVSRWARTGQLRLAGKRAVPGDRIEAGQEIRVPPLEAHAARPARPQPQARSADRGRRAVRPRHGDLPGSRTRSCSTSRRGSRRRAGPRRTQHLDRLLDGLADDGGAAQARPPARQGHVGRVAGRADRARGRAFRQGLLRAARRARSIGRWSSACPTRDEGTIDAPLAKQPGTGGEKMHISEEHGLPAKTRWRMIDRAGNRAAWVELQPLTGRTHQLRAHMAAIGHPIVGDAKYGGPEAFLTGGISRKLHLHARRIRIDAPEGGKIDVTAELPPHFAESLATLGFDPLAGDVMPLEQAAGAAGSEAAQGRRGGQGAAARAARRTALARDRRRRRSGGEPAGDLRLRRHARRQRRDDLRGADGRASSRTASRCRRPSVCRRVIGLSLTEAMAALLPELPAERHFELAEDYKRAFMELRAAGRSRSRCSTACSSCSTPGGRWLAARGRDRQVGPRAEALPRAATASTRASCRCRPLTGIRPSRTRRWWTRRSPTPARRPKRPSSSATRASTWRWRSRPARPAIGAGWGYHEPRS